MNINFDMLNAFVDFFKENSIGFLIMFLFSLVGFFNSVFALNSRFFPSQVDKEIRNVLNKHVKVEKEKLNKIENEINQIITKRIKLQHEIENEIPQKAKIIFIKDQILMSRDKMVELYERHNKLNDELNNLNNNSEDNLLLDKEIVNTINPYYVQKQKKEALIRQGLVGIIILILIFNWESISVFIRSKSDFCGMVSDSFPIIRYFEIIAAFLLSFYILYIFKKRKFIKFNIRPLFRRILDGFYFILGVFAIIITFLTFEFLGDISDITLEGEVFIFIGYLVLGLFVSQLIMIVIRKFGGVAK